MNGVAPTQGFVINITEVILLYSVRTECVDVYVRHLEQAAEVQLNILVALNVRAYCVRYRVLPFRKVNWAIFRT
jgi:hypothetical protein